MGIASDPASTVPGYVLGGLSWYTMPFAFALATTMGLVAVALENAPAFPTYPRRMNATETGAGLVLPYAAQTILGTGGAGAVLFFYVYVCHLGLIVSTGRCVYRHLLRCVSHVLVSMSLFSSNESMPSSGETAREIVEVTRWIEKAG